MKNGSYIHPKVVWQGEYDVSFFCCIGVEAEGAQELHIGNKAKLRSHAVIYLGSKIGNHFTIGHRVMVRELCEIGDHVSIGTGTVVEHHVKIGHQVRIHSNAFIPEFSILEEGCWIGPSVVLTNAKYPLSIHAKTTLKGPIIGKKAKIGANATILPGIHIGEGALIGAGSVVTKDVPSFAVVAGNPAVIINHLSKLPYANSTC